MTKMPSRYQIRVKGHLDQSMAAWFAPLALHNEPNGAATLTGLVRDQAELYGILLRLNNLNYPLISVQPNED